LKLLETDYDNLPVLLAQNVDINRLSFDILGLKSLLYIGLKFGYSFRTHYYLIAQVAAPMLSHVTWALLKLVLTICPCMAYFPRGLKRRSICWS